MARSSQTLGRATIDREGTREGTCRTQRETPKQQCPAHQTKGTIMDLAVDCDDTDGIVDSDGVHTRLCRVTGRKFVAGVWMTKSPLTGKWVVRDMAPILWKLLGGKQVKEYRRTLESAGCKLEWL
jgi:hypothetical protein